MRNEFQKRLRVARMFDWAFIALWIVWICLAAAGSIAVLIGWVMGPVFG